MAGPDDPRAGETGPDTETSIDHTSGPDSASLHQASTSTYAPQFGVPPAPGGETPLDLLLNAISGSASATTVSADGTSHVSQGPVQESRAGSHSDVIDPSLHFLSQEPGSSKRALEVDENPTSPRRAKMARTLWSHVSGGVNTPMSTIQVWHPRTAQKSYGKERRLLYPPPKLSVSGPLLPFITRAKLSSFLASSEPSSSQTHDIPLSTIDVPSIDAPDAANGLDDADLTPTPTPGPESRSKGRSRARNRAQRVAAGKAGWGTTLAWIRNKVVAKEREELEEGLMFPGLYVLEDGTKCKEFRIELELGLPVGVGGAEGSEKVKTVEDGNAGQGNGATALGAELSLAAVEASKDGSGLGEASAIGNGTEDSTITDAALRNVLDAAAIDIELDERLLDYLPEVDPLADADPAQPETSLLPAPGTAAPANADTTALTTDGTSALQTKPWATISSTFLTTVSKPSQKTAKARSLETGLTCNDTFALWSRVHGQTVRTKFLHSTTMDDGDEFVPITEAGEPGPQRARSTSQSQPQRTRLEARTGKWTPFRFEIIRRPPRPVYDEKRGTTLPGRVRGDDPSVITYGSVVALVDVQTGARSDPVKIVRIERNVAVIGGAGMGGGDEGHPVSELQRVGLVRVDMEEEEGMGGGEQGRWYLAAPGATVGAGEVKRTRAKPVLAKDRGAAGQAASGAESGAPALGTDEAVLNAQAAAENSNANKEETGLPETLSGVNHSLVDGEALPLSGTILDDANGPENGLGVEQIDTAEAAVVATNGLETVSGGRKTKTKRHALARAVVAEEEEGSTQSELRWVQATRGRGKDGGVTEDVDDWMCWYIGCVVSFSVTVMSGETLPISPLGDLPRLYAEPVLTFPIGTLELTLSTLTIPPTLGGGNDPSLVGGRYDVYLGPIGPLRISTFRSTAPKVAHGHVPYPAAPLDEAGAGSGGVGVGGGRVMSAFPAVEPHVIVLAEMPDLEALLRVMQECVAATAGAAAANGGEGAAVGIAESAGIGGTVVGPVESGAEVTAETVDPDVEMGPEAEDASWLGLGEISAHAELTIQDALRNAEQQVEMDLASGTESSSLVNTVAGKPIISELAGMDVMSVIDPALQEPNASGSAGGVEPDSGGVWTPALSMRVPEEVKGKEREMKLPIVLVRSDGMALGLGYSVVADRLAGGEHSHEGSLSGQWALRVVQDLQV